eukprot:CAMPEP_0116917652 /NCGR_PEP_ID=MMETSP0467-20121206/19286_1 /TAXON_ID=283647 /ORGANISM="Mesodinium pulex, Strain SPMC105" /LENGTH=107 /DNA_ID=CAMNT_0004594817 /DNA_START=866 /DNA_END=1188 /DNA_ORIENTATION=+
MPKVELLKKFKIPAPESQGLRKLVKAETNLVEFKHIIEQYSNSTIERIDFADPRLEGLAYLSQFPDVRAGVDAVSARGGGDLDADEPVRPRLGAALADAHAGRAESV